MTSKFITFEGIEGSGKTTQIHRLYAYLSDRGLSCIQSKEPGGTIIGSQLREMILSTTIPFAHPYSEVMLFYADRLEHCETLIKPALAEGKIVLCDRYLDSTYAYQVGGREMPLSLIETLNTLVQLLPDLTILLDLDVEEGIERVKKRSILDRFELEDLSFHYRVREGYLKMAQQYPDRIKMISVKNLSEEAVFDHIKSIIDPFLFP